MNNTIGELFSRKSVRVFEKKEIPEDIKDLILQSALQAPTAGNQVLYTILDIQNQKLKDKLAQSCDKQMFIASAPLVLVFLADCRRWMDIYDAAGAEHRNPGTGDILLACQDAIIAAQNTVVAAESLGIGSCYIGDIVENVEDIQSLLALDVYTLPISMVVYGYPTAQQQSRIKPRRFDTKYIVQTDTYKRLDPEQLQKMVEENHQDDVNFDFARNIKAFCKRKYMSDFSAEMSRSCDIYLKAFLGEDT